MTKETPYITASASNYAGTPRKVRLLADFVRGKNARLALSELSFVNKRHAAGLAKIIASGVANAQNNHGIADGDLIISEIQVTEGKAMKRGRPASRGRMLPFRRRLSHINVVLTVKDTA